MRLSFESLVDRSRSLMVDFRLSSWLSRAFPPSDLNHGNIKVRHRNTPIACSRSSAPADDGRTKTQSTVHYRHSRRRMEARRVRSVMLRPRQEETDEKAKNPHCEPLARSLKECSPWFSRFGAPRKARPQRHRSPAAGLVQHRTVQSTPEGPDHCRISTRSLNLPRLTTPPHKPILRLRCTAKCIRTHVR